AEAVRAHLASYGHETRVSRSTLPVPPAPLPAAIRRDPSELIGWGRAQVVFQAMASHKEIAFHYPTDGCYSRAHLMCLLMTDQGLRPHKVWAFANGEALTVRTTHDPRGVVQWCFHVAPTLGVRHDNGQIEEVVIDPSLFDRPVTIGEWRAAQT